MILTLINNLMGSINVIITTPANEFEILTTKPDHILRHDISDEELVSLGEMKRNYLWEWKWATLGLSLGTLPQAFQAVSNAYFNESAPMSLDKLLEVLLFFVSLTVYCVVSSTLKAKLDKTEDLVKEIRSRAKISD
jgi:hypothetical protein